MSSFRLAVRPFILLAACYTPLASALGLGEISLHSALAEPLEADIELIDARGLGADDIKVRLAPNHVFARAGVERPDILAKLNFVPALDAGSQRIRVSSTTPVNEPYLNFIVELTPPGRPATARVHPAARPTAVPTGSAGAAACPADAGRGRHAAS